MTVSKVTFLKKHTKLLKHVNVIYLLKYFDSITTLLPIKKTDIIKVVLV